MDNIYDKKSRLRKEIKGRSSELTREYLEMAGDMIGRAITESRLFKDAGSVFLYLSVNREPDTYVILSAALKAGKKVFVPKCYPDHIMKAVRIENTDDLVPGHLGIPEPRTVTETANADGLDLIIVPCVTASPNGERLGHGAGFYDLFLKSTNTPKVCLCFDALLSNDIPMAEFDVYMDCVVTENGIYKSNTTEMKKP